MNAVKLLERDQTALNRVIVSLDFTEPPKIHVQDGAGVGSGYTTKTYGVAVEGGNRRIELFLKTLPESVGIRANRDLYKKMFKTELRFYESVLPQMLKFQGEVMNGVNEDGFNNVAKCFYVEQEVAQESDWERPIILENLKPIGYFLWNKKTNVNKHMCLLMKTYAKYHAISFAMKDQKPQLFKKISSGFGDVYSDYFSDFGLTINIKDGLKQVLDSLDITKDQKLYKKWKDLIDTLVEFSTTVQDQIDEYAIILHGDCWPNNMMFKYNDETGDPVDVKLCDFQAVRCNSPVLDLCYFFAILATKEVLENSDYYIQLYYDTLSERIRALGSDPEKMYPYTSYQAHWKKYSKFGVTVAFAIIKGLLFEEDEIPDLINSPDGKLPKGTFSVNLKKQNEFNERMINLMKYYTEKDYV